jgi:nitrite reductase (NADH) small subunit
VCPLGDIGVDRGVAALVGGHQIALFRTSGIGAEDPEIWAIANRDPFSDANVLARGIVGSAGDRVYVASPMYKQRFDLRTGECLDAAGVSVDVWPARAADGWVQVLTRGRASPAPPGG